MNKTLVAASVTALAMVSTSTLAMDVGAGMWSQATGGSLLGGQVNLGDDLNLEGTSNNYFYANIELPIPIIPDFKLRQQTLSASGTGGDAAAFAGDQFAGVDLSGFTTMDSSLDLTYTDVVVNWGLPTPGIDIDWGVNFRMMDVTFEVTDTAGALGTKSGTTPVLLPMLHLAAEMDLPGLDAKVGVEYNTLPLDGAGVTDYTIKGMYYLPFAGLDLGVEAGYHSFAMEIGDKVYGADTSDVASNITANGMFFGLRASF